jgi:predicted kinase
VRLSGPFAVSSNWQDVIVKARLVVISGLPASGKTTVGTALSERLSLPLIDKDAILEALFDSLGCRDRGERYRLSRASDEVLYTLAEASQAAVVVNWWDPDSTPARLRSIASSVVEVFCECPLEVAAARFEDRRRHPGHHDPSRSPEEIAEAVRRMRETFLGPLGVGNLVRVDTTGPLDADSVAGQVLSLIGAGLPRA